jgi:phosphoribosyl 1,2-cyclic phosphodiesterase
MKLRCLGSGSSGNCYLLIAGNGETLIIDPGVPIKEIKQALNWNISCVVGAVCTHNHADHAKSVKDLEQMGISVFKPYESPKPMSIGSPGWTIQGFELTDKTGKFMHTNADGSECPCYGFLISHPEMGRLLYITDTELVKWRFKNVNQILVEANYSKEIIQQENPNYEHVCRGHMELGTTLEFLKVNKGQDLRNVVLLHLSDNNSDAEMFAAKAKEVVGMADVYVADKEMEIELNKDPF